MKKLIAAAFGLAITMSQAEFIRLPYTLGVEVLANWTALCKLTITKY